jgi:hypothetical protein
VRRHLRAVGHRAGRGRRSPAAQAAGDVELNLARADLNLSGANRYT